MQITDPLIENPTFSADLLQKIRALVSNDMDAISDFIYRELSSNVPLTREITDHIFKTKGKQLRPLLAILSAHAFADKNALSEKHHALAVVIEFVHTATLLHDDVVDHSTLRRGKKTANAIWGNAASVLVGDFLYSRAFQILSRNHDPRVMQVLSETTNAIAEGEVQQLMNQRDAYLSEENYFRVITQKTARLFSAAAEMGAILENAGDAAEKAMATYGLHLGLAFQIIDDLLDYETSSDITGKNIGDDLAEGKATLPLIYAMQKTSEKNAALIRDAIKNSDAAQLPFILKILKETDAFFATREKAREQLLIAEKSLALAPESQYRDALKGLLVFAVERSC
ncbi:MAG: polyprenyl synthetase family protein [Coxiellaceae bacterium]|nr:polyprenyl synthetase family protein [Coxiellaceae bacterium]